MKLERLHEGPSAQMLHVGPYSDEPKSQKLIQAFIEENGYRLRGCLHEIYTSDLRRASLEKGKTILRHPLEKVA